MAVNIEEVLRTLPERVVNGLKWLWTREELEVLPEEEPVKPARRRTEVLAWLVAREGLSEEVEAPAETLRRRGSLLRYIVSGESLGFEAPLEEREDTPGPVRWLLKREELPYDEVQESSARPRRSLVRHIFSAEELDELEEGPPRSRQPLIRWLFSREPLEEGAGIDEDRGPGDA